MVKYTGTLTGDDGSKLTITAAELAPAPVPTPVPTPAPTPPVNIPVDIPAQTPVIKLPPPPQLVTPIVKRVTNADRSVELDDTKDYVLQFPEALMGRTDINGGRNVHLIGPEIHANTDDKRALYLNGQQGIAYVEGLRIKAGVGQVLKEGVNISNRGKGVYLVNFHIDEVKGEYAGHHADVWQCWGMKTGGLLHIERGFSLTSYQWGMWQPRQFESTATATDFTVRVRDCTVIRTTDKGYTIYDSASDHTKWDVQGLTVLPTPGHSGSLYHGTSTPKPSGLILRASSAEERNVLLAQLKSPVIGKPGVGYVSPGYRA